MAEGIGGHPGGILGLLDLLDDPVKKRALERDLIAVGLRLRNVGSEEFDWRDLIVFVREADQDSAIYRAFNPDWMWTHEAMLLADVVDTLSLLAWMQSEDGRKKVNRPKPIPRPGTRDRKVKGKPLPMNQVRAKMAELRAKAEKKATRVRSASFTARKKEE